MKKIRKKGENMSRQAKLRARRNKYTLEKHKTKEEWVEARGIGGSSAAAILGLSNWHTTQDIYDDLALGKVKKISDNERMQDGRLSESAIRQLFILDYKRYKVKEPPKRSYWMFRRKDKPYITLTPDALLKDTYTGKLGALEIKNVEMRNKETRVAWETLDLPDQYYWQVVHYFVAKPDIDFVIVYAHLKYFAYNELAEEWQLDYSKQRAYYFERLMFKKHIDYLENEETKFYENYVAKRKRPPLILDLNF